MSVERVIVRNYRALRNVDVTFGPATNIIVGNNETGKSTLLEAINLALKCQLGRRPAAYELHPFLFNAEVVAEFVASHRAKKPQPPPEILIELYLKEDEDDGLADLQGSINSLMVDQPGISLAIRLDEKFKEEYREYIADPDALNGVPIEYYEIVWQNFSGHPLQARAIPLKSVLIDPSSISNTNAANRYILEIVRDYLDKAQAVELALSYHKMRDDFVSDERIAAINKDLASKTGRARRFVAPALVRRFELRSIGTSTRSRSRSSHAVRKTRSRSVGTSSLHCAIENSTRSAGSQCFTIGVEDQALG